MPILMGVDGGGTKTECAAAEGERILARSTAGTCKIQLVGKDGTENALRTAIVSALDAARLRPDQVESIALGLSGAGVPGFSEMVHGFVRQLLPQAIVSVAGDQMIAHEAAYRGGAGVIIISGTGSIVFGRNEQGRTARAGGWGPVISDEGSGSWIGRRAVMLAMRAHDRGENTLLIPRLLDKWRVGTSEELVAIANAPERPDFSALFPLVVESAFGGDKLAIQILREAGEELAALSSIVANKLWPSTQSARVCAVGGVVGNSDILRKALAEGLAASAPQVRFDATPVEPVFGALYLAAQQMAKGKQV